MPSPKIVGYVTRLGYLRCMDHAPEALEPDASGHPVAVWSDTGPHNTEPCDTCGQVLAPEFCRACGRIAGNPSDRYGDPAGLCWPCHDRFRQERLADAVEAFTCP